jgi:beta-glucanase (GH16 family)
MTFMPNREKAAAWCISLFILAMPALYFGCNGGNDASGTSQNGHISPTPAFQDDFNSAINESLWQIATWSEHGGQTGRDRCYAANGVLNMIFINDPDAYNNTGLYLSAAIQTWQTFLYGRWEARLKPSSVSGVLNSLYTIDWGVNGTGTKQEIDIEFLTYTFQDSAGAVHFAVHAEGLTSFNTNPDVTLDFNPSDDFHVWGFEITPEHVQWFVDNRVLQTYPYQGNPIAINSPYQLKLNVWSAVNWINGPPAPNTPATYQIDWIRFYPYIAGD